MKRTLLAAEGVWLFEVKPLCTPHPESRECLLSLSHTSVLPVDRLRKQGRIGKRSHWRPSRHDTSPLPITSTLVDKVLS